MPVVCERAQPISQWAEPRTASALVHSFTQTMGDFLLFSHIQGDVILSSLQPGELASCCAEPEPQRLFAVSDRTFEGRDSARPAPPLTAGAGCTWCVRKPFQSS